MDEDIFGNKDISNINYKRNKLNPITIPSLYHGRTMYVVISMNSSIGVLGQISNSKNSEVLGVFLTESEAQNFCDTVPLCHQPVQIQQTMFRNSKRFS